MIFAVKYRRAQTAELITADNYRGKWTFLREWFQSNKVAKDILEEK